MPATLHSLRSKVVTLPIRVDEDAAAFTIKYRPHNMTAAHEAKAAKFQTSGQELGALIELVLPVIDSWDLREYEDGPIVELTREALTEHVPADILLDMMNQISEDRKPDPKETGPL